MSKVDDWQNVCKGNKSRAAHILKTEKFTDCEIVVGQDSESDKAITFRGHKLILAMASQVFERMFYGSFDDRKSNEIRIPDMKHNIFQLMMNFIYIEELEFKTIEDAIELYYTAEKYMMRDLMRKCIEFLKGLCPLSKIWKIYEFALLSKENDLISKSSWFLAVHASRLFLKDPGFLDVNITTVIAFFERDKLNISSELDLFEALNKYALANGYFDTENSVTNKEAESEIERRKLLKEALKRIRFLCLAPEQFEIVAKSGLLTESEVLSILLNINNPSIADCPMPEGFSNSRSRRRVSWCWRS